MPLPKPILHTLMILPLAGTLALADPPPVVGNVTVSASDAGPPVVTPTRLVQNPIDVPNPIWGLSSEQVAARLPRTLPEALRETPGVSVQKTSNGQGSPYIRGLTGFRTLALIDGVRFNNSTMRDGPNQYWSTIDLLSLDRIELVPGQGSVLFGSDAAGGTLNALTKHSGFRGRTGGFFADGQAGYRWSSAEGSHVEHAEVNLGQAGKWGLHLDGSLHQFGDVDAAGIGHQPKTGYDQWAYNLRFDAALSDDWTFTAVHQQLRQDDVWRTHSTIYGIPWHGTTIGSDLRRSFDQERTLSYLRLAGKDLDGFADSAGLTLSYQTADETQHRIRGSGASDLSEVDLGTVGIDFQLASQSAIGTLAYGVDFYHDAVASGSTSYKADGSFDQHGIQGPVGDDSSYDLFGAYLQDQIDLGRVHLFLGARYTHAAADIGRYEDPVTKEAASFDDSWDNLVGSARIVCDLDDHDHYALYGGISQGFRAPNLSDLSRLDIARSGELEVPSPDLDPEMFLNFEVGLKAETDHFTGSVSYFHTWLDDTIVRRPTGEVSGGSNVVTKANAGDGFVHGVELVGRVNLDGNWSVFANAAWTEGEVDQYPASDDRVVREPLTKVVPLIGNLGVRWQTQDQRVWVEGLCTVASDADRLCSADRADTQRIPPGGTPGWTLVTLRGGWKIHEHLCLTASLDNLLDEEYRIHGSGSNEPGFGGTIGVTVSF